MLEAFNALLSDFGIVIEQTGNCWKWTSAWSDYKQMGLPSLVLAYNSAAEYVARHAGRKLPLANKNGEFDWVRIDECPLEDNLNVWLYANGKVVEGHKYWRQGWDPVRFILDGDEYSEKGANVTHWKPKIKPAPPEN